MANSKVRYVLILGALTAMGPLCTDFYLPSLPAIASVLNASTSTSQLTLTSALIGLGAGQLLWGPASDRLGRVKPLLVSLVLFLLASVWCTFAHDIGQLIIARFIQGIAGAGGAVLARAIARDRYYGHELTRFFAVLMVVNGLAPIVAPVLGGALLSFMNWKGLFLALSVVSAVLLLVSFYGLEETWSKKTTAPGEISGVIKSFVLIGSDWKFIGLCLTQGFMMAGMFAYIGASSYVLQKIYALTPQAFSLCFAINGLGLILFSLVGAELSGHYGEDRILRSALIFAIVAAVALFICGYLSFSLPFILVALFFAISINSIICTIISSLAMQRQGDNAGSASACLGSAMFILGGISVPLTGLGGISINTMTIIILVCYIIAALLYKSLVLDL